MSDSDLASFYQQHKDDSDVWEEDATSAEKPRPLGATISVRLSADDASLLRRAAKELDLSYSDLVRQAVSAYLRPRYTVEGSGQVNLWAALVKSVHEAQTAAVHVTLSGNVSQESRTGQATELAKSA